MIKYGLFIFLLLFISCNASPITPTPVEKSIEVIKPIGSTFIFGTDVVIEWKKVGYEGDVDIFYNRLDFGGPSRFPLFKSVAGNIIVWRDWWLSEIQPGTYSITVESAVVESNGNLTGESAAFFLRP